MQRLNYSTVKMALNIRQSARTSVATLKARLDNGELAALEVAVKNVTLENLESHYNRFLTAHYELVGEAQEGELGAHEELLTGVENNYTAIRAALVRAIEEVREEERSVSNQSVHQQPLVNELRLGKVNIPKFAGEFHKWIPFRDMYLSLVHGKANLSTAVKYTILMESLTGEARQVIAGFLPTDDNYKSAWDTLMERYDNPRLIVSSLLTVFLGMETLTKETNTTLRRIVDITNETTRSLKALKRPVEHWDDMLVHIIITKLPKNTIIHWEMEQAGTELPKLDELLQFIAARARGLDHMVAYSGEKSATTNNNTVKKSEATAPKSHTSMGARSTRTNAPAAESNGCHRCSGPHMIAYCPELTGVNPLERFERVKGTNLCYNCLTPGHSSNKCLSHQRCRICGKKHHTILCRSQPTNETKQQATQSVTPSTSQASGTNEQ